MAQIVLVPVKVTSVVLLVLFSVAAIAFSASISDSTGRKDAASVYYNQSLGKVARQVPLPVEDLLGSCIDVGDACELYVNDDCCDGTCVLPHGYEVSVCKY